MDDEIRRKILALLDQHRIMTVATLRPDGDHRPVDGSPRAGGG